MKKTLLSICLALCTTILFAQQIKTVEMSKEHSLSSNISTTPINSSAAVAPFWTNTFDDPSEWTMVDLANGGLQNWIITTNGPQGGFSNAMGVIASTSASDGFALYDSDFLNTSYIPQEATLTYNNSVDCSNYQYVNINFECYHRVFRDSVFVEVSTDPNFSTFGRFRFHEAIALNASSDNPDYVSVNVSSIAGGQPNVYFRFHYEGEWDYAIMIDDVSFSETPDNKLTMSQEVIGGWWVEYLTAGGLGQDYTFNPMSQATANPYAFEAVVKNEGVATQNTQMNVLVEDATGMTVLNTSSNTVQLTAAQQDTFVANNTFSPSMNGLYNMYMWAEGDSAMTDTAQKVSVVTDYNYGKDYNNAGGYWRIARPVGGFEVASDYDIYSNTTLYSIDAFITDWSAVGAKVYAMLYEIDADPASTADPFFIAQSDDYTIQVQDRGNWINIDFLMPQQLIEGTRYSIALGGYQHPIDSVGIHVSGEGDFSVDRIYDKSGFFDDQTFMPDWYTISSIPMLRMNLDPASAAPSSSYNLNNEDINLYNIEKGIFKAQLPENSTFNIHVTNMLGQLVYSISDQIDNSIIDLSKFEKGVYNITIKNYTNQFSYKVVLD